MARKLPPRLNAFARVVPILGWLPNYERASLRPDVIAGLTVWGLLVPEGIAYAAMAGAPHEAGLYTLLGSLIVYAILGTSRQFVSAATSATSIMMAAVVSPFVVTKPGEYRDLLVVLVLVVGIIFVLSGLLRLGFVTAFISHSVMTGFIFGLAIYIAVAQAPKIFGLSKGHGETLERLWHLASHLGQANWVTVAIGIGGLALLHVLAERAPRAPAALTVMVIAILAVSVLGLSEKHGVQIVGAIEAGLPKVGLPEVSLDDVLDVLPGAFAIVLVVLSEALGIGHTLATKHGYEIDPNQDLIAIGAANLASSCLGGLVNGGSVSSSAVNDRAGAKTQVSSLVAGGMVLITLIALMPLFHDLPDAILGAIVIHAVARLMRVGELKRFYQVHRSEFGLAMVALLGVIGIGILPGLLIAVVVSLLRFVWGASHLSVSQLCPVPGKEHVYDNIERLPEAQPIAGLAILRLNGPLFFANVPRVRKEVRTLLSSSPAPEAVVLDLHANFGIDISSTDMLLGLVAEAESSKTEILFTEIQDPVRHMFRRCGLLDRVGGDRIFPTIDDGVQDFLQRRRRGGYRSGGATLS